MKITKDTDTFSPVTITLETKEEAIQMFAMLNHTAVSKNVPALNPIWTFLDPMVGDEYKPVFKDILTAIIACKS